MQGQVGAEEKKGFIVKIYADKKERKKKLNRKGKNP